MNNLNQSAVTVTAVQEAPTEDKSYTAEVGDVICTYKTQTDSGESIGFIRVEQTVRTFNDGGWTRNTNRSALIKGTVEDLEALNLKAGQKLPGKIVVQETTEEPYPDAQPKMNPSTEEIITHQGQPVYRETFFTQDMSKQDTILEMDKVGETSDVPNVSGEMGGNQK